MEAFFPKCHQLTSEIFSKINTNLTVKKRSERNLDEGELLGVGCQSSPQAAEEMATKQAQRTRFIPGRAEEF